MTERMRSGDPDKDFRRPGVIRILDGEPTATAILALCCAERLSLIAERLATSPSVGSAVRTGLDLGWSAVTGHEVDPGPMAGAISTLDVLLRSPDARSGKLHMYLDDSICAAIYALEAVRDRNSTAATNAVARCEDVYFQLATSIWPRLGLDALRGSPVVQEEISRQIRDAQMIASWAGAISPEGLSRLREAAQAEGSDLVSLIRGDAPKPEGSPSIIDQESLF